MEIDTSAVADCYWLLRTWRTRAIRDVPVGVGKTQLLLFGLQVTRIERAMQATGKALANYRNSANSAV